MRRENTFKIDYSSFPVKPSFEKVHGFCRSVLGLKKEDVQRLQCHRGGACAFVKVNDLALAQKIVDNHDEKHEVELDGKKHKLRITMEDGSVEVKVHDLPEDVSEEKVVEFLSAFGEVLSIRELMWGEGYDFGGISLGIWSARMLVKKNIDSWVTIDGERALVVYKGQLQSCRHCHEQAHTGISCVQNKKLLVQKSYANVTKQTGPRPQPKPAGPKPVKPKPTAPPTATLGAFPELPKQTDTNAQSSSQAATAVASLCPQPLLAQMSSSQRVPSVTAQPANTSTATVDLFKKPPHALRSQSKSGNGNETDESSTSTSSRRDRADRRAKKPRRTSEDEERGGEKLP
ncbi:uncharacterized protein LOC135697800 [Ochlerotatus camptorhynchus]|uniref:uncharacterized protein LOC135697800 n=1 Tax=Ochlerotatus camptorhynchus TaxID=644619 RepID=UPI0031D4F8C8